MKTTLRFFPFVVLGVLLVGCGKSEPLAGGKPVAAWIEALQDPDPKVRKQAAHKLGNVGPADAAALPALLGALRDRDAGVRCEVILAVLKCGPDAQEAIPALTEAKKKDADTRVRDFASKALAKLQQSD